MHFDLRFHVESVAGRRHLIYRQQQTTLGLIFDKMPPKSQKEDQHACRVTRKKVNARKMLGTSRIAVFFQ